jgi:hypothetical protein
MIGLRTNLSRFIRRTHFKETCLYNFFLKVFFFFAFEPHVGVDAFHGLNRLCFCFYLAFKGISSAPFLKLTQLCLLDCILYTYDQVFASGGSKYDHVCILPTPFARSNTSMFVSFESTEEWEKVSLTLALRLQLVHSAMKKSCLSVLDLFAVYLPTLLQ